MALYDNKNIQSEREIADKEAFLNDLKQDSEETMNALKTQLNRRRNELTDKENKKKDLLQDIALQKTQNQKAKDE